MYVNIHTYIYTYVYYIILYIYRIVYLRFSIALFQGWGFAYAAVLKRLWEVDAICQAGRT